MAPKIKYIKLNAKDKKDIRVLYNKIKYNVFGTCKRIKYKTRYPKKKKMFGKVKSLYHYTIAYAHKHKKLLNYKNYPKLCISHLCGNAYSKSRKGARLKTMYNRGDEKSLCINWEHLVIESIKDNSKRRICHSYIRKFYTDFYKIPSVSVKGKLTIDVIKDRLQNADINDYNTDIVCCHSNNKKCFICYN